MLVFLLNTNNFALIYSTITKSLVVTLPSVTTVFVITSTEQQQHACATDTCNLPHILFADLYFKSNKFGQQCLQTLI
jgi:hypothetical protein